MLSLASVSLVSYLCCRSRYTATGSASNTAAKEPGKFVALLSSQQHSNNGTVNTAAKEPGKLEALLSFEQHSDNGTAKKPGFAQFCPHSNNIATMALSTQLPKSQVNLRNFSFILTLWQPRH